MATHQSSGTTFLAGIMRSHLDHRRRLVSFLPAFIWELSAPAEKGHHASQAAAAAARGLANISLEALGDACADVLLVLLVVVLGGQGFQLANVTLSQPQAGLIRRLVGEAIFLLGVLSPVSVFLFDLII